MDHSRPMDQMMELLRPMDLQLNQLVAARNRVAAKSGKKKKTFESIDFQNLR